MPSGSKVSTARHAPSPLAWRVWPVFDSWTAAISGGLLPLAAGAIAGSVSGHLIPVAIVMLTIVGSMWRIYMPVYYELNALGITQQSLHRSWRIPWQAIHYSKVCDNGIFVAPVHALRPWSIFRGLMVPTAGHEDEALDVFAYYREHKHERDDFSYQSGETGLS